MRVVHDRLEHFMGEALREGRRALPGCLPNPPVGCVLVRGDRVIARGFTNPPGNHHAEAMALGQLSGELSDVSAFVTLEPCSFDDRTPSCARALAARRVAAVYVAILDPHPRNRGAGLAILRDAGIQVVTDLLASEALRDLAPYLQGQ